MHPSAAGRQAVLAPLGRRGSGVLVGGQVLARCAHRASIAPTVNGVARPIQIAPSVLPADFAVLGEQCQALEAAGVDRIHWDVMDGQFVPNITLGPDIIASVRPLVSVPFEVHLMVVEPDHMLERWVEAGCQHLIVHAES
ncbi:hypothetical protein B7486_66955, partial [cyanobacterium TDX16]